MEPIEKAAYNPLAVKGGIFRIVFAGALVALLALALAACGGDDDESGTTTSNPDAAAQQEQGSAGKDEAAPAGKGGEEKADAGTGSEAAADVEPAPLKVSGGGSEQFRVKGGDNSIQTWGEESDEAELEAAAEAVHAFFVARANEEWGPACDYLGEPLLEQLKQFAPQQEAPDCVGLLKAATRHPLPASVRREPTIVDAGSLRIGEDNSFLIYRGVGGTVYAMPLVEEDGEWKLTLLSPSPIG